MKPVKVVDGDKPAIDPSKIRVQRTDIWRNAGPLSHPLADVMPRILLCVFYVPNSLEDESHHTSDIRSLLHVQRYQLL